MWKKIVLSLLIIISGVAGFFVAKAQVTIYDTLNHMDRDYDTRLANVDLKDIDETIKKQEALIQQKHRL